MESDKLKQNIKIYRAEIDEMKKNHKLNIKHLEGSLKFSMNVNQNLKNDYDLLQEKFDKHLKTSNNIN